MISCITINETIIFSPQYNKQLDFEHLLQTQIQTRVVEAQVQYKKIIFSDHKLNDSLLANCENYENYVDRNRPVLFEFIGSKFNHPLLNSLNYFPSLTHIIFGCSFNQPLSNSLCNLTSLTYLSFKRAFNQPLSNELHNLISITYLNFGCCFNQPLHNPKSLTHIKLSKLFNCHLHNSLDNCT